MCVCVCVYVLYTHCNASVVHLDNRSAVGVIAPNTQHDKAFVKD